MTQLISSIISTFDEDGDLKSRKLESAHIAVLISLKFSLIVDDVVGISTEFLDHSTWADATQHSETAADTDLTITESPGGPISNALQPTPQQSPPPISRLMKQIFPNLKAEQVTQITSIIDG